MKAPGSVERPTRVDARRNRERLVAAARETFAEAGPEASLNEIARRAGVGPGTLYRHFPSRRALLAAVLQDRVATLCGRAAELLTVPSPDDALAEWLRALLDHARVNQGLGIALLLEARDDLGADCHQQILDAASALLTRAQREGTARPDLTPDDLLGLVAGIALSTAYAGDLARPERLLALVLDAVHRPA